MNTTFPLEHQMLEIQKYITKLLDIIIEIEFHKLESVAENILFYHMKTKNKRKAEFGFYTENRNGFSWNMVNLEVEPSHFLLNQMKNKAKKKKR